MSNLIQGIMDRYQNYDLNADGDPSIINLSFLDFEQDSEEIEHDARRVVVLVESRLLNPLAGAEDLESRLIRFKGDLRAEGFSSYFISAELYNGPRHQDGRTLLALRSFLREIWNTFPNFLGVVLVGSFPEAELVRRTMWTPHFKKTIAGVEYNKPGDEVTPYLAIEPEHIAGRSDIVLADFNGNWEALYHEEQELESIVALPDPATAATEWPVDGAVFSSLAFDRTMESRNDFFYINDSDYLVLDAPPGELKLFIRHRQLHPEIAAADRNLPNPIARPDIVISRINARHIAINPDPTIVGENGVRPIDEEGYPQSFISTQNYDPQHFKKWQEFFEPDPVLERRVICDYFDLNHRHRTGCFADLPFRAGAIGSHNLDANPGYVAAASDKFQAPLVQNDATLLDYFRWFKQPAVLRCIHAHSGNQNSNFGGGYDVVALENELGGKPFRWSHGGNTYTPSLQGQGGNANFFVHRTAWQNGILENAGANLIVHAGCSVNVPAGTKTEQYYKEGYAGLQNAEALLFYMNGVAMIARAKGFWDLPTGFPGAFAFSSRARFGDGWRAFYDNDAANVYLGTFKKAIDAKKAYFWSMIGDWTVRLFNNEGLGILDSEPQFKALHIHADQAWIEGWNFDTRVNDIVGTGDIDGDGRAEFVITSNWGIGILKHDGQRWRQIMVAPNDTRFGGWRYNASVNVGEDRHHGVGNFTGGAPQEILLTSSWGIGVLAYGGNTLTSPIIQPNGTRFGGWLFDSRANQIAGVGDVDGNGRDEIVMTSGWGIGVLGAVSNTFDSLMVAPNGTHFGGWVFNSSENTIHPLADYDGDGQDEILITSDWGIGVLKHQGNTLNSIAIHANGSDLNGYILDTKTSQIVAVGDLAGDGRAHIVISDADGLHIMELKQGVLRRTAFWANGDNVAGWRLNTDDNQFGPVGDIDGDGREEVVIRSPWGVGIIGLEADKFRCPTLHANGTHLGDWILEDKDRIIALDNFTGSNKCELLVQKRLP
ncbi:VCBS repeat-containing protein [Methanocalculus sp.]|uniref:FG-GAP repeat domain-containing protein n=1 Tax=Methanocalculus sp. TaxID=2004547 RepID=UPI0026122546|nr:VCBS repeat-containing protein [Methanocalculus sp.]MDG6250935.1 VCBS repeat-containing protein [Methanocalculus sp.]